MTTLTRAELVALVGMPNVPARLPRRVLNAPRPLPETPVTEGDPVNHAAGCPRRSPLVVRDRLTDQGAAVTWCPDCMRHGYSEPEER